MAESTLGWDDPASPDKSIHSWQRTIGGTAKEMQIIGLGEHYVATYTAVARAVPISSSAAHTLFIQGDGTNYTRIMWIKVVQHALAGAAATADFSAFRTTTAGSGGTSVSAYPMDTSDTSPYAGVIQYNPSSKGTEGVQIDQDVLGLVAAQPMDARNRVVFTYDFEGKPLIIQPATTNGICLKVITGIATATVDWVIRFKVTSFS
jgi:hypothetical protein